MNPESTARLLVVEDEEHIATGLKLNLELEGYEVLLAPTARQAFALLVAHRFDLILLDVMLPDMDGFALCQRLRESGNYTPVLMLTARNTASDRVQGLDAGADDYLAKPFELDELIARVRSILRRRNWERGNESEQAAFLTFGNASVNFDTHEATVGEAPVHLTQLELDLLRYFASHPGRVLNREELLEKVWKLGNYPNTRTVDNFVARLRKYFEEDPSRPRFILSVRGSGYKFEPMGR